MIADAFTALVGVHPQALFWSIIGATLGLSWSIQASRSRAITVYVCVVLASTTLGTLAATLYVDASANARNAMCLLLGIVFHPLFGALLNALPAIVGGWVSRLGGRPP